MRGTGTRGLTPYQRLQTQQALAISERLERKDRELEARIAEGEREYERFMVMQAMRVAEAREPQGGEGR